MTLPVAASVGQSVLHGESAGSLPPFFLSASLSSGIFFRERVVILSRIQGRGNLIVLFSRDASPGETTESHDFLAGITGTVDGFESRGGLFPSSRERETLFLGHSQAPGGPLAVSAVGRKEADGEGYGVRLP